MDYKELLIKYVKHVGECEGTNFIDQAGYSGGFSDFTKEEVSELNKIDKQITDAYNKQ